MNPLLLIILLFPLLANASLFKLVDKPTPLPDCPVQRWVSSSLLVEVVTFDPKNQEKKQKKMKCAETQKIPVYDLTGQACAATNDIVISCNLQIERRLATTKIGLYGFISSDPDIQRSFLKTYGFDVLKSHPSLEYSAQMSASTSSSDLNQKQFILNKYSVHTEIVPDKFVIFSVRMRIHDQ